MISSNSIKKENQNQLSKWFFLFENRFFCVVWDAASVLGFAILTGLAAGIKWELGVIPLTMQTLAVLLSGAFLDKKKAAFSQVVYLLYGLLGLPWFSRGGGLTYVISPTFGYLLGFPVAAYLVALLLEKSNKRNLWRLIKIFSLGSGIIYLPGILWLSKYVGWSLVIQIGLWPFVLGDIIKSVLAAFVLSLKTKSFCNK